MKICVCSIEGCTKPVKGRGWCSRHYHRWTRHGDPLGGGLEVGAPARFIAEALLFSSDECLIWPFSKGTYGYGQININGKPKSASRVVCERVNGDPPTPKHDAAHLCGNGHLGCVNPRHLYWATRAQNVADMIEHGTFRRGERCGFAKLTRNDVLAIRALKGKQTNVVTAHQFGVSLGHVSEIQNLKTWSWL